MKILMTTAIVLLLGVTAAARAQTLNEPQNPPDLLVWPNGANPNQPRILPLAPAIERGTTGLGSREPEAEFLFAPGTRDPQRNDPTAEPFGPMNNIP